MKIAVLSDAHDNIWSLERMLREIAQQPDVEALIFCGDFCAPFTLQQIAEGFAGPVHVVFGNNDGDQLLLSHVAGRFERVRLHGIYAELEYGGRRIAVVHYPQVGRRLAQSAQFDLVCYGHDHTAKVEQVGESLLVNPGEVMGRFGQPSYGLYDTESGEFTLHPTEGSRGSGN